MEPPACIVELARESSQLNNALERMHMLDMDGQEAELFRQAINALNVAGVPYVIGGAFAVYHYGGLWRNTNDLDVYVEREKVSEAALVLMREGFLDCGEMAAGDRDWIYHTKKEEVIVDVIWHSPTGLPVFGPGQYERAPHGEFLGLPTRFLPADDLVLAKIFTMNLHRCDWPDVLRIVRSCPEQFDWQYLVDCMGEHWPVLLSFIILFDWLYPSDVCCIPVWMREELLARKTASVLPPEGPSREVMLDPWIYTRPVIP